ncbi:MAG: FecR family protein [Treponema sp.]|jgi:hypothetical protein|nr:FecR family protein [Treponema sp.]
MKKIFLVVLLFTMAVCVTFAQTSSPSGAVSPAGVIRELTGEVELKLAGSSTFVPAKVGDVIASNTIVSTGFRSTAVIAVGSSVITVQALTRLSLAEIQSSQGAETINVDLQAGRVRVEVSPPAGTRADFSVQSPSATASVRGTSFVFDTLNLTVNEGTVAYIGSISGPSTMVSAGSYSFIGTDKQPADPVLVMAEALLPSAPIGMPSADTQTQSTSSGAEFGVSITYPDN